MVINDQLPSEPLNGFREMNLTRSILWLFLSFIGSTLVVFIGLAYFAQTVPPAALGSFFLFRVAVEGISMLSNLGLNHAAEKRVSEDKTNEAILSTVLLIKSAILIPVCIIILIFQTSINGYIGASLIPYLIVSLIAREFGWLAIDILRGELRVAMAATIEMIHLVIWIITSVSLVSIGYGLQGIVIGFVIGLISLVVLGFWSISLPIVRPTLESAQSLFDFAKYDFISSIDQYSYNWLDVAIIGLFLTPSSVAFYEYAWQVTLPILFIAGAIGITLFPQISRWTQESQMIQIGKATSDAIKVGLYVTIPAFFGILIIGSDTLYILFGPEYTAATIVLVILSGEKVFRTLQVIFASTLRGLNRPAESAIATGAATAMNIVLNLILVPSFGIVGAAVATITTVVANTLVHWWYLRRQILIRLPPSLLWWYLIQSIVMAAAIVFVKTWINVSSVFDLIGIILIGVFSYIGLSIVVPTVRKEIIHPACQILLEIRLSFLQ